MCYNNPPVYRVDITPEMFQGMADVDNIVCIKEASGDVRRVNTWSMLAQFLYSTAGDRGDMARRTARRDDHRVGFGGFALQWRVLGARIRCPEANFCPANVAGLFIGRQLCRHATWQDGC